jgi:mono/diheme cytochrome c family protein
MVRKLVVLVVVLGLLGLAAFWFLTMPRSVAADELQGHQPDLANGAYMFEAAGCESCHAAPASAKCDDPQVKEPETLAGGRCLITPFGTFNVPNISPDPDAGIGGWTTADFVTAMKYGIAPGGTHLYPAFPYYSYQRMKVEDMIDIKAHLDTLPKSSNRPPPHDLGFPFNFRRGLGLWQLLYIDGKTFQPDPAKSETLNRGAYLVHAASHCSECHSPRNFMGGIEESLAFSGALAAEGSGWIPNITTDPATGIGDWSHADIVTMLETGFTPEFDSVGGPMAAVQKNMAKLTAEDRAAIAEYLKSLPPIKSEKPAAPAATPAS